MLLIVIVKFRIDEFMFMISWQLELHSVGTGTGVPEGGVTMVIVVLVQFMKTAQSHWS